MQGIRLKRVGVRNEGIILEPSDQEFENRAVLSPACVEQSGVVHMFYRAVREDWVSSVGYCQLKNNEVIKRATKPVLFPEHDYEKRGIEDPRIVPHENLYYMFYTAYDGDNARVAYATSPDLINFTKQGLISSQLTYAKAKSLFCANSPAATRLGLYKTRYKFRVDPNATLWEKDAFIFPKKINNKFAMFLRILPGIQLVYFNDFDQLRNPRFWEKYLSNLDRYVVMEPKFVFEHKHIGGGVPPILTREGWLFIYHAVEDTPQETIYHAAAALLDAEDPTKVIGRLDYPLFSPSAQWELSGDVNNVVFPTSAVRHDDRLFIYYTAADKLIGARSVDLDELITVLKNFGR